MPRHILFPVIPNLFVSNEISICNSIKKEENQLVFLCGSGSGIRTARPSGYEPDELPTALSRDIGLQIYVHFLKLQILFLKIYKKSPPGLFFMTGRDFYVETAFCIS